MRKFTIFIVLFFFFFAPKAQTFQWSKQITSCKNVNVTDVALDKNNNIYVTGSSYNINPPINDSAFLHFDTISFTTSYYFLAKYNVAGKVIWAIPTSVGSQVVTDSLDNVYVAGSGLAKYDLNGNSIWSKFVAAPIEGLGIDEAGNLYISGSSSSYSIIIGADTLRGSPYSVTPFVAKFDNDGNPLWLKRVIPHVGTASQLSVDANGNSYITGWFNGHIPAYGLSSLTTNGSHEAYIAKYDASGNVLWIRQTIKTLTDEEGIDIAVGENGSCYATGHASNSTIFTSFSGSQTLQNGGVFIVKYDSSGNLKWLNSASGYMRVNAIAANSAGSCFITGFCKSTATFGNYAINPTGNGDMYVAAYNNKGKVQWVQQGTNPNHAWDVNEGMKIAADNNGNCYLGNYLQGTGNFGNDIFTSPTVCGGTQITGDAILSKIGLGPLKVNPLIDNNEITIYPNPTRGIININYKKADNLVVEIRSIEGKSIYTKGYISSSSDNFSVDLTSLTAGLYIMEVSSPSGASRHYKVVLE